jgi:cystathionine gamma-synthase
MGTDIVVHSTTKYIGGHSDALGGAVLTNRDDIFTEMKFFQNAVGAVPSILENILILRGAKTLSLRMEQACDNAEALAKFLCNRPEVKKVLYPGLPEHPGHTVVLHQMSRFGAILSFELKGNLDITKHFINSLRLVSLAVSLGAVESLIEHP